MRFALVIPALNEEQAIAGTLRRALAARASVLAQTPVQEMLIVFVNDGCTDRTQEIVDQPEFREVIKVNYGRNRGYGAAIKAGFHATDADLVGFIDADGTCEPEFCVPLIQQMLKTDADVVLAARLSPNTQMPLIRKIGNRIFALLLGVMSGKMSITDTASGFRICKRASLKLMSPLPDGLHFTPTQSAICLLDPRLKIEEVHGMHYKEREGRSKLSVLKDGFRFLWTILFSAACYSPIKTMLMASGIVALLTLLANLLILFVTPEWGPVLFINKTSIMSIILLLGAGVVAHELNFLLIGPRRRVGPAERLLQKICDYRRLIVGGGLLALLSGAFNATLGAWHLRGYVWEVSYWILEVIASEIMTILGVELMLMGILIRIIWAVGEKQKALLSDEFKISEEPQSTEQLAIGHKSLTTALSTPSSLPKTALTPALSPGERGSVTG